VRRTRESEESQLKKLGLVAAAAVWRNEEEDNEIMVSVLDGLLH
jgi:hypothetical protein